MAPVSSKVWSVTVSRTGPSFQFALFPQPSPPVAVWNLSSAARSVAALRMRTVTRMVSSTRASAAPAASTPSLTVTVREYASSMPAMRSAPEPV